MDRRRLTLMVAFGLSLLHVTVQSYVVMGPYISASEERGDFAIVHDEGGFHVLEDNGDRFDVPRHLLSVALQNVSEEELQTFLNSGGQLLLVGWGKEHNTMFSIQDFGKWKPIIDRQENNARSFSANY